MWLSVCPGTVRSCDPPPSVAPNVAGVRAPPPPVHRVQGRINSVQTLGRGGAQLCLWADQQRRVCRPACKEVISELERLIKLLPSQRDAALGQAAAELRSWQRVSSPAHRPRPWSASGEVLASRSRRLIHFAQRSREPSPRGRASATLSWRSGLSRHAGGGDSLGLRSGSAASMAASAPIAHSRLFLPTVLTNTAEGGGPTAEAAHSRRSSSGERSGEHSRSCGAAAQHVGSASMPLVRKSGRTSTKLRLSGMLRRMPRLWRSTSRKPSSGHSSAPSAPTLGP